MTCTGWEYAEEASIAAWVPYERNTHLSRRRRWIRLRARDKNSRAIEKKQVSDNFKERMFICSVVVLTQSKRNKAMEEGWEYARLAHLTYHITQQGFDFARRRRWMRKLVNTIPGERAVFK